MTLMALVNLVIQKRTPGSELTTEALCILKTQLLNSKKLLLVYKYQYSDDYEMLLDESEISTRYKTNKEPKTNTRGRYGCD